MKELFSSRYFALIFIPVSFIFILIYSWATSPLFLGDGLDSSIFKTIGLGLTQGKIPYTDLFDHKGGLLFLIQAAGYVTGTGRWGLFIIQVLFLTLTLISIYSSASLFIENKKAFGATMACLLFYTVFIESGNQCETYMLPFTGTALYLALRFIKSGAYRHPIRYSLIYGLCFAAAFWIRPNDAVSQVGAIMAGIFILLVVRKEYTNALGNAIAFLGGAAAASFPLMAFFAYHDSLYGLLEGTFLYNMKYVSEGGMPSIEMILIPLVIFGSIILMNFLKKEKDLNYIFIPMLILTLLLIGKRNYPHYLIIMVVPSAILFSYIIREKWRIVLSILLIGIAIPSFRQYRFISASFKAREQIETFFSQTERIISHIPEDKRDEVWSLNLLLSSSSENPNVISTLGAILRCGITPCNRIFVPFHLNTFPEEEKIFTNMPEWVLADPTTNGFDEYTDFLSRNYTVIDSTDSLSVGDLVLYRLNDRDL